MLGEPSPLQPPGRTPCEGRGVAEPSSALLRRLVGAKGAVDRDVPVNSALGIDLRPTARKSIAGHR
ncbi:hypothetical protein SGA01_29960 [Streptomyces gardneri]|uniref:Uncharacterized protein n=1 Tax=Streptomyces gardneri TaxID=66892 RepID=A0A4Y3RHV7_9ACTN|nr:hypothetical protein SGA01_29960 [Streptomyces gardneri]